MFATPDPSASLTAYQVYQVARDAVAGDYIRLGIVAIVIGAAIIALALGALAGLAMRRA